MSTTKEREAQENKVRCGRPLLLLLPRARHTRASERAALGGARRCGN